MAGALIFWAGDRAVGLYGARENPSDSKDLLYKDDLLEGEGIKVLVCEDLPDTSP